MPTLSDLLRPLVAGRKLVLAGAPLAAMTGMCRQLRELGAERPFLLATGSEPGRFPRLRKWTGVWWRCGRPMSWPRSGRPCGCWTGGGRHCPGRGCQAGFNGGAFCLRWVRSDEDAAEAARFLGERCDQARVMPFLEGIPCSIHGMVFPHGVATFRPVELVTLRQPGRTGSNGLRCAGAATFWDPPAADREVMRDLARRVGSRTWRRAPTWGRVVGLLGPG